MTTRTDRHTVTRRGFLRESAIIGGAAATGAASRQASADTLEQDPGETGSQRKKGYRETPHVREYYDKARL